MSEPEPAPWWFDGSVAPGWLDYVGLLVALVGFGIAIWQIAAARKENSKTRAALELAQKQLSQRALMNVIPQVQSVVDDLGFAMPNNDVEVAKRSLVRFALVAREGEALLAGLAADYGQVRADLKRASEVATKAKAQIASQATPDVTALAKSASRAIDSVHQELTSIVATVRYTVEGAEDV